MIDMLLVSLFMHAKKVVAIVKIVRDCGDADVSGEVGRDGDGKDACGVVCLFCKAGKKLKMFCNCDRRCLAGSAD